MIIYGSIGYNYPLTCGAGAAGGSAPSDSRRFLGVRGITRDDNPRQGERESPRNTTHALVIIPSDAPHTQEPPGVAARLPQAAPPPQ